MSKKDKKDKVKKKDVVYNAEEIKQETMMVKEALPATPYKAPTPPSPPIIQKPRLYTYKDYLNWPEDERVELIDGIIYNMSAPSEEHQRLLGDLHLKFRIYLQGKECRVYLSPFDVRIDLDIGGDSVVQPDIVVICEIDQLDEKGLNGAPDLAIEILSPSSINHDKIRKYNKYLSVGVREYWIVDPKNEEITVNILKFNNYHTTIYQKGDIIKVHILDNLYINTTYLFDGYEGSEIMEVELARIEEQEKAEYEKATMIKRFLELGLSNEAIAKGVNVDISIVIESRKQTQEAAEHLKISNG